MSPFGARVLIEGDVFALLDHFLENPLVEEEDPLLRTESVNRRTMPTIVRFFFYSLFCSCVLLLLSITLFCFLHLFLFLLLSFALFIFFYFFYCLLLSSCFSIPFIPLFFICFFIKLSQFVNLIHCRPSMSLTHDGTLPSVGRRRAPV